MESSVYEVLCGILEVSVWVMLLLIPLVIGVFSVAAKLKDIRKEMKESNRIMESKKGGWND